MPTFEELYGPWICAGCGYPHEVGAECYTAVPPIIMRRNQQEKTMPDIKLDNLRELKDDWDNDGAVAPTEEAIQLAERILNMMQDTPARVEPCTDGGVLLTWSAPGIEIETTVTPEGTMQLE